MKKLYTLLFLICAVNTLSAQLDVGEPEENICVGDSVLIGLTASQEICCFEWSPKEGLTDLFHFSTFAKPSQTTTYTLKGWDKMGNLVDEESVVVNVFSAASIAIEQEKCCFRTRDQVDLYTDFTVTTTPENFPGAISRRWDGDIYIGDGGIPDLLVFRKRFRDVQVLAVCYSGDTLASEIYTVEFVEEENKLESKVSIPKKFENVVQLSEKIQNLIPTLIKFCEVNFAFEGAGSVKISQVCCGNRESPCILEKSKVTLLGAGFKAGTTCKVPLPAFLSPFGKIVAGLELKASASGSIETQPCTGGLESCYNLSPSAKLSLGFELNKFKRTQAYDLSINSYAQIKPPSCKICMPFSKSGCKGPTCIFAGIEGKVKFTSFINKNFNWVLADHCY